MLKAKELRARLGQAGLRSSSAPVTYVTARILAPLVLLGIAFVYLTGVFPKIATGQKFAIYAGIVALGFYLPQLWLSNKIQKRQQVLTRSFPDSLDLMVICVEAGLSLEGAFARVTEEVAESAPEMAEEIGLTAAELAFLGDRRQAYENFAERTGLPAVKSLATTLIQAERYGTSIAVGLRVLSQENRDARLAAAEKKAGALPAKLTVPMIVFFLPVLFLVIAGPAVIQIATR
jgi:tight adherence protein C